MAVNDYRGYLQNPDEMESGQGQFCVQNAEPVRRPLILGTLAVMGLLQVASSVALFMHLTGYLHEVDFTSSQQRPVEEVWTAPFLADALKDPRKRERPKCLKTRREAPPAAHLPIKAPIDYVPKGEVRALMVLWNEAQGHLEKMGYDNGRIWAQEAGLYYVYAKTCFRYYGLKGDSDSEYLQDGNLQLIQYVYHERQTQYPVRTMVLMKSGSTKRWRSLGYNMYCQQQGGLFRLKEGDGLHVRVSNSGMLDPESEGSYFGAFQISN